ncbi:hypothetical protein BY996DRAFT_6412466 [Phakopsora pachyrhizi]|nr:hypothetical protein BY996DRAFT_6412466 [Phakopsora pachyrhizi]
MAPLENNTQIPSPTISCPTVSLICPISSPSTFLNTSTGCITEQNERQQDGNSNGNSEDNDDEEEDEDERKENDANEVNTLVKNQKAISVTSKVKEAIDLLRVDEEKVISGQPLPLDSNIKIGNTALLHKRK